MEEKKTKQVSLTTILLIIAVIIIIIMACYIFAEKTNTNTTQEPQTQIDVISNSQENESISNDDKTNTEVKGDDEQKIISILKNADNDRYAYFDVNKINHTKTEYTVETTYNKPITITKDKLENLKNDKKIILNNELYEYIADQDNPNGYIQKNGKKYEIINYNNVYAFSLSGIAGGYPQTLNTAEDMIFVADGNMTIYDSFEGKSYKLKDITTKNWLNKSLKGTIVRLQYSDDLGLSIFIDNK